MPIERDIFLDIFETCCFQLRVESIKTPKYFIYSFSFMAFLINLNCNTFLFWFIIGMEDNKICFIYVITDSHLTRETTCLIHC